VRQPRALNSMDTVCDDASCTGTHLCARRGPSIYHAVLRVICGVVIGKQARHVRTGLLIARDLACFRISDDFQRNAAKLRISDNCLGTAAMVSDMSFVSLRAWRSGTQAVCEQRGQRDGGGISKGDP
jgi:hypothetical protein